MYKKILNIGIVGAGRWANFSHLPSLASLKNVEIIAVSNLNYNSAVKIANKFNIKYVFKDWRELVNFQKLDAVLILSPPQTHYTIAMAALRNKKHVLCEDPLAINYTQAKKMLKMAEDKGLVHGYVRPKLYIDGGSKIKELLLKKKIGKIQNILITWRPKVWLNKETPLCWRHMISQSPPLLAVVPVIILIDLFGEVEYVNAEYEIFVKKRYSELNKRIVRVTAPDYFHALLKLKSGIHVTIQAGREDTERTFSGFQIFGEKGTILWEWTLPNRIMAGSSKDTKLTNIQYSFNFKKDWKFDQDFIAAIMEGSTPQLNFKQGVYEMKVIDAINLSAKNREWVTVEEA